MSNAVTKISSLTFGMYGVKYEINIIPVPLKFANTKYYTNTPVLVRVGGRKS